MCLVKSIAAVIVIGVLAVGALWYLQSPSGTWVVDREAMQEQGGEALLERITDSLIVDFELVMTDDEKFTLWEGEKALFAGTWSYTDGKLQLDDFPLDEVVYSRPDGLTVRFLGKTVIFKRQ